MGDLRCKGLLEVGPVLKWDWRLLSKRMKHVVNMDYEFGLARFNFPVSYWQQLILALIIPYYLLLLLDGLAQF